MKHRVADLEGALLDAAVAKAEGQPYSKYLMPSKLWEDGGPILDRERIAIIPRPGGKAAAMIPDRWRVSSEPQVIEIGASSIMDPIEQVVIPGPVEVTLEGPCFVLGETPLIAAMRAFVASKFGEEIEL